MATTLTATNQEYQAREWEEVPCPFCGESAHGLFERFGYKHQYQMVKCHHCGLAYQSPRPRYDEEFTHSAYEVYSASVKDAWDNQELTDKGKIVFDEYAHILKEIEEKIGKKGSILDVGCNTGFFLKVAKDEGWNAIGVDISKTMTQLARDEFQVDARAGDWMKMDFPHRFDAVYCSHVIEHVPDPESWLLRFREVLNPGGIICLSVPNYRSIDRRYKRALKRLGLRKDKWAKWRTPDHLYEPCEKSLTPYLKRCGFKIDEVYTYPSEWDGHQSAWHKFFHGQLRWGAKARFYFS